MEGRTVTLCMCLFRLESWIWPVLDWTKCDTLPLFFLPHFSHQLPLTHQKWQKDQFWITKPTNCYFCFGGLCLKWPISAVYRTTEWSIAHQPPIVKRALTCGTALILGTMESTFLCKSSQLLCDAGSDTPVYGPKEQDTVPSFSSPMIMSKWLNPLYCSFVICKIEKKLFDSVEREK